MSMIVDALEKVERTLSRERGEFTLFAPFERQDIPLRWDLVVAAPWIEQVNEQAMHILAAEMKKHLPGNQIEGISRIVPLDSNDAIVRALIAEHSVEHGRLEIEEGAHYGMPAGRGYLITCRVAMYSEDPQAPNQILSSWPEIAECLGGFPAPKTAIVYDDEGEIDDKASWVFRGLKSSSFGLQPTIEREAQSTKWEWPALERHVSNEFKARARMHLHASLIPGDELGWLALMQHYAIPTRLLDFTYSPFVALYFAIRAGYVGPYRTHVRLWAVDAIAVSEKSSAWAARRNAEAPKKDGRRSSINPFDFSSQRDAVVAESQGLSELIEQALAATGRFREELNRMGCIFAALPSAANPRLVSQQGVFLFNCAEGLGFQKSLTKMMEGCRGEWCKTFDIPVERIPEIESRLFQMNIHEQSLLPDLEGLAGLIRQKIRLHWK